MTLTRNGFSVDLWDAISPIFDKVLEHPFVKELQDGTLSREVFQRFIVQDSLYLRDYGQCLAMCGALADDRTESMFFCESSRRVVETERTMHTGILAALDIDAAHLAAAQPSPTTTAYTNWERRACWGGKYHEAAGAVLPCFWFYADLGTHLIETGGSANPLYQGWIDNYSSEGFLASSQSALDVCARIGGELGERDRDAMIQAVVTSARYEWMFWDSAYGGEQWAI